MRPDAAAIVGVNVDVPLLFGRVLRCRVRFPGALPGQVT